MGRFGELVDSWGGLVSWWTGGVCVFVCLLYPGAGCKLEILGALSVYVTVSVNTWSCQCVSEYLELSVCQ